MHAVVLIMMPEDLNSRLETARGPPENKSMRGSGPLGTRKEWSESGFKDVLDANRFCFCALCE